MCVCACVCACVCVCVCVCVFVHVVHCRNGNATILMTTMHSYIHMFHQSEVVLELLDCVYIHRDGQCVHNTEMLYCLSDLCSSV